MKEFIVIGALYWIVPTAIIIKEFLIDLYSWQIKEYRVDRFWSEIRWDQETNRHVFRTPLKFIAFSMVSLLLIMPDIALIGIIISFVIWSNEFINLLDQIVSKKVIRPKLKSPRNLLAAGIFALLLVTLFTLLTIPFANLPRELGSETLPIGNSIGSVENQSTYIFPDTYIYIGLSTLLLLFIDLSISLFTFITIYLTWPVAFVKRKLLLMQAKNKLQKYPSLTSVGITGSLGKTTTKELLYNFLKDDYEVAKTPENYNTDLGVAKSILTQLKSNTQIFVAEMGAIRKGEIRSTCKLLPPDIAIVTDVDQQHIGIFGSQKKLAEAKSELVQNMKSEGIAVLNGNNKYCRDMMLMHNGKSIIFSESKKELDSLSKVKQPEDDFILISKENDGEHLVFKINHDTNQEVYRIEKIHSYALNNILCAILVARELNVDQDTIYKKLQDLDKYLPRLTVIDADNGMKIVDDSYSSNPKGFIAAVDKSYEINSNKKIIVSSKGILELGRYKEEIYSDMLEKISKKIKLLVTTDSTLAVIAEKKNINVLKSKKNMEDMLYSIRKNSTHGDTILLEGRQYPKLLERLISEE